MNSTTAALMSMATDTLTLQAPVVAAARRWVAADAAEKAARTTYDLANDEPYSPERGPTMSSAIAATRAAWAERTAAAAELARAVAAYNEANP